MLLIIVLSLAGEYYRNLPDKIKVDNTADIKIRKYKVQNDH